MDPSVLDSAIARKIELLLIRLIPTDRFYFFSMGLVIRFSISAGVAPGYMVAMKLLESQYPETTLLESVGRKQIQWTDDGCYPINTG